MCAKLVCVVGKKESRYDGSTASATAAHMLLGGSRGVEGGRLVDHRKGKDCQPSFVSVRRVEQRRAGLLENAILPSPSHLVIGKRSAGKI